MQQLIQNFYSLDINQQKQLISILTGQKSENAKKQSVIAQETDEESNKPAKQKNSSKIEQPRGQTEVFTVESSYSNTQNNPPQVLQMSNKSKKVETTNQNSAETNIVPQGKITHPKHYKSNIVTKYAFATRVGYMPGNPLKQN